MAEVVELDVLVQAAVAETFERLRVGDSNAESLRIPIVNCAWKRDELVDGNLVWSEFQHERDRGVLLLERAGESIDPACLDTQPGGLGRPNAARDLRRCHPFLCPAQDLVRTGFHSEVDTLATGGTHRFCHARVPLVGSHLGDPSDAEAPRVICAAVIPFFARRRIWSEPAS